MRENRTYGLTRGRSGSAASLYSTGFFLRVSAGNKFGMTHICGVIWYAPGAYYLSSSCFNASPARRVRFFPPLRVRL
jgi:hypothetical protein